MASQLSTLVALDLSTAGAPRSWRAAEDPEGGAFIMGRLAGLASLADAGDVDLIALDETFRVGGPRRRDAWLDGAVAASRLARHTTRATLVSAVPLGVARPENVAGAIASVHRASAQRAGWQLETAPLNGTSPRAVDDVLSQWRSKGATTRPTVVVPVRTDLDLELAAARADVARLAVATLEEARAARAAIRQAAVEWGRRPDDVRVVVDLLAVVSVDRPSAQARWDLLNSLETPPPAVGLRSIGTAGDLVNLWSTWVAAGAADGFTVVPGSVPTDVQALTQEVLPRLAERGLRTARTESTTAARGTRVPATRAARSRARA